VNELLQNKELISRPLVRRGGLASPSSAVTIFELSKYR
jgi:hypothetical protein